MGMERLDRFERWVAPIGNRGHGLEAQNAAQHELEVMVSDARAAAQSRRELSAHDDRGSGGNHTRSAGPPAEG
jgi:hypothetical protein